LNSIIITGRITHDIELKTSAAGTEYTNFSVAVDRRRKDKDGNKQTDFFKVSVFGKTAAFVATYMHKGDGVNVQGRMESDKYTNKDGVEVTGWTLMAENVEFPHGKSKASSDGVVLAPTELTGSDKDLPF
jgi:single-strand DNA-binding protein